MRGFVAALGAALVVAACGGGDTTVAASEPVTVTMSDYRFRPPALTIPAEVPVTLEFVNDGQLPHEFMAGRQVDEGPEGRPHGFVEDLFAGVDVEVEPESAATGGGGGGGHGAGGQSEGAHAGHGEGDHGDDHGEAGHGGGTQGEGGHGDDHGFMVTVDPGQTVTITFTLPADRAGEWTMGCFEQDGFHWEAGMQGRIRVTAA